MIQNVKSEEVWFSSDEKSVICDFKISKKNESIIIHNKIL